MYVIYLLYSVILTANFNCSLGYLKCPNSYCIPPTLLCNGVPDCQLGEDEQDCGKY